MKHSTQCLERQKLRENWLKAWPHYCRECKGYGASYRSFDPSPGGVSLSSGSMPDVEPCPICAEKGRCPRCGENGLTSEEAGRSETTGEGPCIFCKWDYVMGGMPEIECDCSETIDQTEFKQPRRDVTSRLCFDWAKQFVSTTVTVRGKLGKNKKPIKAKVIALEEAANGLGVWLLCNSKYRVYRKYPKNLKSLLKEQARV